MSFCHLTLVQYAYRLGVPCYIEKRIFLLPPLVPQLVHLPKPWFMLAITSVMFRRAYRNGCSLPLEWSPTMKDHKANMSGIPRHRHLVRIVVHTVVITGFGFKKLPKHCSFEETTYISVTCL